MGSYNQIKADLKGTSLTWLVTGAAGFIGSNLVEELLKLDQKVIGLDNYSTGLESNLDKVRAEVLEQQWKKFNFLEGDICDEIFCKNAFKDVDHVLHQAALGSVPRSIKNPLDSSTTNINGFLNILNISKNTDVKSFTFASSSSVYGDHPILPKSEDNVGKPLSTYALTKAVNEDFSSVFALNYGFKSIGLRYFNVFGKRQNPDGDYAAVIPKWISSMLSDNNIQIFGDGTTSRDFCYIDNVVQINILAALAKQEAKNNIYNVAFGENTSLLELFLMLKKELRKYSIEYKLDPEYSGFREGDVRHSLADISKARKLLGYEPAYNIEQGLAKTLESYLRS